MNEPQPSLAPPDKQSRPLPVEFQPPEALQAVVKSLYTCARVINGEPVHVLKKIDSNGEEIWVEDLVLKDPDKEIRFNNARKVVDNLRGCYSGQSLHLIPRERDDVATEQGYKFLVNITGIDITDTSIALQYQPNGELLEVDLSKLGLEFDIEP